MLSIFKVTGKSMEPYLHENDYVLVCKYVFSCPGKGDVIILKDSSSGRKIVKRISRINGKKYFVTGDNSDQSTDSRKFGWIDKDKIIGRVILKF